ncbi:hypothetical protein KUV50_11520 [Membranicola marinus]|uniref:Uncharacterized protein n=1 Tax=Membranihabitans marinus TaxID=1227546 RepID=A0A953LAJ4_9BACT|nr:hypothetical protein [Membranihabitans marinus]MBY5958768.1 hypothetical protein [Membranihabitans marinus]
MRLFICLLLSLLYVTNIVQSQENKYNFEALGKPVRSTIPIQFVTSTPSTGSIAWASLTDADRSALIGINLESGELTEIDLTPYGKANGVLIFKESNHIIHIYAGVPGRFFRYDVNTDKLSVIGEVTKSKYWMSTSYTIAPDGKIYVGTYPRTAVSVLDPETESVEVLDQISSTPGTEYVINPASSDDGIIYFPTGMHHGELWVYNPETKTKKQILPEYLQTYGQPRIWIAEDGKVYGKKGSTKFLCTPDGIIEGKTKPKRKRKKDHNTISHRALFINEKGALVLEDIGSKERIQVKSEFEPPAHEIYSIGDVFKEKLYGSSLKPGHVFTFDLKSRQFEDLGKITRGGVQVYDILSSSDGLYMSSYTGGYIDYFDYDEEAGPINQTSIAHLKATDNQERIVQMVYGENGHIYAPTFPIKGYLGGVLTEINTQTRVVKTFKGLIKDQSLTSITSIPMTGELLITSSIYGGTSAKPKARSAFIFIWDPETETVKYKSQPIPTARKYGKTVLASNGMVYGTAKDSIYAFDPINYKVTFKGKLKTQLQVKTPKLMLSDRAGRDGILYGVDVVNGQLFSIDSNTNHLQLLAQDDSIIGARFAEVKDDGYLYYPHDAVLMRVKVVKE